MPLQLVWVQRGEGHVPRLQVGRESLMMQGYPIARIPSTVSETSELHMQEIGGNMMSLPVLLAFVQSLFASLPWRGNSSSVSHTSERHVEHALRDIHIDVHGRLSGTPATAADI